MFFLLIPPSAIVSIKMYLLNKLNFTTFKNEFFFWILNIGDKKILSTSCLILKFNSLKLCADPKISNFFLLMYFVLRLLLNDGI